MKNQDLDLFSYGNFQSVDDLPMDEIGECMKKLTELQKQCGLSDLDRLVNLYRDGQVGKALGFDMVNVNKHGVDCKAAAPLYLEVKSTSIRDAALYEWNIAFNDTNLEKARFFQDKKAWLAVGVFEGNELLFILWGQNRRLGDYLEDRVLHSTSVRCSQYVSLSALIKKYGFKIISVSMNKEEVIEFLNGQVQVFEDLDKKVINLSEFRLENESPYARRALYEKVS